MKKTLAAILLVGAALAISGSVMAVDAPDNAPTQDKRLDAGAMDCSKGHTNPAHYGERVYSQADDCSDTTPAPLQ